MKIRLILFFTVFSMHFVLAQENVFYLKKKPLIDGTRDDFIPAFHLRDFKNIYLNDKSYSYSGATYFLGYTSQYLYLYIEAEADSITCRDRAYQNGDGLHLTLGMAREDSSDTDEFYVLGFSPSGDWTRKLQWYYNIDLSMKRLGDDVMFESKAGNGTAGFELLIPWNTVAPYHPWVCNNIGFNLCFVKAAYDKDKIYHFIKTDWRMQSEQSKRKYVKLTFEEPRNHYGFYAVPARNNYTTGDTLTIKFSGYALSKANKKFEVNVLSENDTAHSEIIEVETNQGFSEFEIRLQYSNPRAGNYMVEVWDGQDRIGKSRISVFGEFNGDELRALLARTVSSVCDGTYNSLLFYLNELEDERKKLKIYEASPSVSSKITEMNLIIESLKNQDDPFISKKGLFRRAFLSDIDHTLRPYSVYVPDGYNPKKQYPLLVYLHGSGQDDRALFTTNFIKNDFIILAPNGRGTSNCYATPEALTDIREAIADVQKNYNIDTEKIILSGFSMGGYGVYRAYYEFPELFNAVAVLSGHPNLAHKWGVPNPVDFLDPVNLSKFADVPFFIYHGRQDQNCPYDLILNFASLLKKQNGKVLFVTDEKGGHGAMNEQVTEKYHEWLRKVAAD